MLDAVIIGPVDPLSFGADYEARRVAMAFHAINRRPDQARRCRPAHMPKASTARMMAMEAVSHMPAR